VHLYLIHNYINPKALNVNHQKQHLVEQNVELHNRSLLPGKYQKNVIHADFGLTWLAHAESRISGLEVEVIGAELSGENEKQVFNASFFSNIGLIVSTAGSFDQRRFFINFLQSCCLM
jgi:hypothetical protein